MTGARACDKLRHVRRALIVCGLAAALLAASASAASSPLAGVYQVKIKGKITALNGTWLVSIAANGAYAIVKEPSTKTLLIGGTSTVSGGKIAFHDKTGPLACTGASAVGRYSWALSGKSLKLTKTADTCVGRALVLTSSTLVKVR